MNETYLTTEELSERIKYDPGSRIKYAGLQEQIVDVLRQGSFTSKAW